MMEHYDKYKDSGIEWVGKIPEEWEAKKIKHRCYVKGRVGWKGLKATDFLSNGYSYLITGTDFKNDEIDWDNCWHIDKARYDEDPFIQLQNDDLLITKDGTIGKLAVVTNLEKPACLNSGIFVVRSLNKDFSTSFLFWLLKSNSFSQFNEYTSYGSTIQHLYQNVFLEFWYPFPNVKEQTTIANYLDRKTTEIDQLIAQKERLLCLYEEEKTAIINQAVTQGINPDVKLKDSGIDWLGEIPETWEVKKLKYVTSNLVSGPFGSSLKKEVYVSKGYKIYGQEQVIKNDMSYGNYYISEDKYNEMNRYKIVKHDILISCVGTFGKILLVPEEFQNGIINPRLIKLSPIPDLIEPLFLSVLLKSPISFYQFDLLSRGGTMGVINLDLLKQLFFSIPPLSEQTAIVHYIETYTTRINAKISKTKKIIALQKEYRTALISEVVTGKIKVTQEMAS